MRAVIFSDSHLANHYSIHQAASPKQDAFVLSAVNGFSEPISYGIENDADFFLFGGDLFNVEKVSYTEVNSFYKWVNTVREYQTPMYLNLGNHEIDYVGHETVTEALSQIFDNIYVAENTKPWTKYRHQSGLNIYLMPYCVEGVFSSRLRSLLKQGVEQPACLCIHQNIRGVQIGSSKIKTGFSGEEICKVACDNFKFIVCGHLHGPFYEKKNKTFLIVPGSTASFDFKDRGIEKKFFVLFLDKEFNVKKIEPKKIKSQIYFKDIDFYSNGKQAIKGDFRNQAINLKLPLEQDKNYEKIRAILIKQGAVYVQPEYIKTTLPSDTYGYAREHGMSIEDWLNKFLGTKTNDPEEINHIIQTNQKLFG